MQRMIENLRIGPYAMRYSQFVPRLYNYCRSLGFERDRMMPSRAFCSDESQGYPVILLAQHFGTFPFDHGRVGGKVAVNRHGPYAHHGEDLVIIQASHVGYDADTGRFGVYKRHRTDGSAMGANCGKLSAVLQWYQEEYRHAREQVLCGTLDDEDVVVIDNQFLDPRRHEGLFLHLEMMVIGEPVKVMSTAKVFRPSMALRDRLPAEVWLNKPQPIGAWLTADLFSFQRAAAADIEGHDILEVALAPAMPALVTSANPALDAARFVTQVEFDRCYRSILREQAYTGKNLLFISGVNIDVSPREGFPFPLIKFVPWAAYASLRDGRTFLLEQAELNEELRKQSPDNPDRLSFDDSIRRMADAEEIRLEV
jgi:Limiting CO2-inducible proteins B/C beta carbonyic anhydrases